MASGQASIQALLGGLIKNRQLVASMRRVMVMSLWERVVGPVVAQKSWAEKVKDNVLTVGVVSHAWASELQLLKTQILSRYRQLLGKSILKDIEFHVSRRKHRVTAEGRAIIPLHPSPGETLPANPVPDIILSDVSNPEIRELLGPLFSRLRAKRSWKEEHGWGQCKTCHGVYYGESCTHCARDGEVRS